MSLCAKFHAFVPICAIHVFFRPNSPHYYLKGGEICLCIHGNVPVLYNNKPTCKNILHNYVDTSKIALSSLWRPSQCFTERPWSTGGIPFSWSASRTMIHLVVQIFVSPKVGLFGARDPK